MATTSSGTPEQQVVDAQTDEERAREEERARNVLAGVVEDAPPSRAVAVRERSALATADELSLDEIVAQRNLIRAVMSEVMEENVHYGKIPGVSKPSLFKPGAETLLVTFRLDAEPDAEQTISPDGHLSVTCRTTLFHIPTGLRVGSGLGSCTTRESKYALLEQGRVCPTCGSDAIIKGKAEYGGGWVCFKRKGGCGAKYADGSEQGAAFEQAVVGKRQRKPEELADLYNTILKMAAKRSLVAATLNATAASDVFTQDVEDVAPEVARNIVRDEATQGFPVPKGWAEIRAAVDDHYGPGAWKDFGEFVAQTSFLLFDETDWKQLSNDQKNVVGQKAAGAACWLRDHETGDGFPPPNRAEMQAAFAAVLDGQVLEGPEWAMTREEVDAGREPHPDDAVDSVDDPDADRIADEAITGQP